MNSIQAHSDDLGFDSEGIHLMASIKYWALLDEASKSVSFSRLRKHFMNDQSKDRERQAYGNRKYEWIQQWYELTAKLLGLGPVLPEDQLKSKVCESKFTESKKSAICVELATFSSYYLTSENKKEGESLSFDDDDRKLYLSYCADIMDESPATLWLAWKEFNNCIEKIVKANSGQNYTWAFVGVGVAALAVFALPIAGVIGGVMGLSGAAASSAGLALLGGGSLAAGGLGMTGGYIILVAGGAIISYGTGSMQHQQKLREISKEDLLINCGKLFAAAKVFDLYGEQTADICKQALRLQTDLEADADNAFLGGNKEIGQAMEAKSQVMRSFRRLLRGDLH